MKKHFHGTKLTIPSLVVNASVAIGIVVGVVTGAVIGAMGTAHADDITAAVNAQAANSIGFMFQNISRFDAAPGSVMAAPTHERPNYYYHWIRDAAIVMDAVVQLYARSNNPQQKQKYRQTLIDYISFSRRNQLTPNRSGGLGEPKFNQDGSAFTGDWGRPQNDGPALRATALTHLAKILLQEGQANYVRQALYDGKIPTNSVIKADLEYVAHHWQEPCFDLWEEVNGHHFYTLMVQRRSMIEGAILANILGDGGAADFYRQQAQAMALALTHFWNPQRGILIETVGQISGLSKSGLDVAVILGAIHGNAGDGFLSPGNEMVLSTASILMEGFNQIYPINSDKTLGPAIGRYPEDVYNGDWGGDAGPWFLATLAYAELCNQTRVEFAHKGHVKITEYNRRFLTFVTRGSVPMTPGIDFQSGSQEFAAILTGLGQTGDMFLRRVLVHRGADGSLSEQFSRHNGFMMSAANLSWSHAAFITAAISRYAR